MNSKLTNKPLILCIMDGWGLRKEKKSNAIKLAKTLNYDYFLKNFQNCELDASGLNVGLPKNQIGNSEVGHMNIGAGRVILQTLPKINLAFENNEIISNKNLNNFVRKHSKNNTIHILGLCSSGGVHSHKDHIIKISNILCKKNLDIALHLFSDGRDVSPHEFGSIIGSISKELNPKIKISSLIGRFFAMDRDKRWERTKKSYDLIVEGKYDFKFENIKNAIDAAYSRKETDEFISPTIIGNYKGVKNNDSILILNFRADRVRQLLDSLLNPSFNHFKRNRANVLFENVLGLTEYSNKLKPFIKSIFKNENIKDTLGEIISKYGLLQLRLAETEKYPHVTYFFNGGIEQKFKNEDRTLIPSPKVKTYDLKPEMSAKEIEKKLVLSIKKNVYDLIIVNFANPDMVGHTGNLSACIKSVEAVDQSIGKIKKAIDQTNGIILITSDHGNCELMWDERKKTIHTAHTTNKVPFILVNSIKNNNFFDINLRDGKLADIAPTILKILDLNVPKKMNGQSLIFKP